jgi:hypothetical protein
MCGGISPLLQYAFMALYLVKHRDNFTFILTLIKNMAEVKEFIIFQTDLHH